MNIRCWCCHRDPTARWRQQPRSLSIDPYKADGAIRDRAVFACFDHLSARRQEEVRMREMSFFGSDSTGPKER